MKTDLIKKIITALCVAVIIATFGVMLTACDDPRQEDTGALDEIFGGNGDNDQDGDGEVDETLPALLAASGMQDTWVAPEADVVETVKYPIAGIISDDSLTDVQKIQQIMSATEQNEIKVERFNYFQYKMGTTDIDGESGTLLYQRTRRQNQQDKDDTTIKLPVKHNFNITAVNFVQDAMIRLVHDNKIYRIEGDVKKIAYDDKTGYLSLPADAWKKGKHFGDEEFVTSSQNLEETKKTCVNWECANIVKSEGASITQKTTSNGDVYYVLSFTVDLDVANADETTIAKLENDNSGSNMSLGKMEIVAEVWECGLMKYYETDETWSGEIGTYIMNIWFGYKGSADSQSKTWYSYTERDNDMSESIAILGTLL